MYYYLSFVERLSLLQRFHVHSVYNVEFAALLEASKRGKQRLAEAEEPAVSEVPEVTSEGGELQRVWQPYSSRICSDPSSKEYLDYKRNKIKQDKLLLLMQNV